MGKVCSTLRSLVLESVVPLFELIAAQGAQQNIHFAAGHASHEPAGLLNFSGRIIHGAYVARRMCNILAARKAFNE